VSRGSRCSDGCWKQAWLLKNSFAQDSHKVKIALGSPTNGSPSFLGILYPLSFGCWGGTWTFSTARPDFVNRSGGWLAISDLFYATSCTYYQFVFALNCINLLQ
jgi:hypothetical protein